jgi:hypothetical protein
VVIGLCIDPARIPNRRACRLNAGAGSSGGPGAIGETDQTFTVALYHARARTTCELRPNRCYQPPNEIPRLPCTLTPSTAIYSGLPWLGLPRFNRYLTITFTIIAASGPLQFTNGSGLIPSLIGNP